MRHFSRSLFAVLACCLLFIVDVHAGEDWAPLVPFSSLPWYHRITLRGFVDVYYAYNFNRPADGSNFTNVVSKDAAGADVVTPLTGTSGKRANELGLNLAVLELNLDPEPFGIRLVLNYGHGTEVLHAFESRGVAADPGLWRFVQEASVTYKIPLGTGLLVTGGIFPSHIGFEVLASKDNWNYTRSWVSDLAPFYQAGLRLSYAFTKNLSAQVHVLNGWQVISDNNEAKTLGAQLLYTSERLTVSYNLLAGPESPGDNRSFRVLNDLYAYGKPLSSVSIGAVADLGVQEYPDRPAALWAAGELFLRVQPWSKLAFCLRGGVFYDPKNAISGAEQLLGEGTATVEVRPAEEYVIKLEGRYDRSTAAVFSGQERLPSGSAALRDDQGLVLVSGVASF